MAFGHPKSVRGKLLSVVMLTTLVALLAALLAMIGYDLHVYHRSWLSDVSSQAELLARASGPALEFDDARTAEENLALLRFRPKVRAGAIYDAKGRLFARYPGNSPRDEFPAVAEADTTRVEDRNVVVFRRIVERGEMLGTVYLRADYELYQRIGDYVGILVIVTIVGMLVAFAMSSWLQRIVTRPILAIGDIAREVVEKRDYSRRARKISDDEVGALVESFNGMLAEIERQTLEAEASNRKIAREVEERREAQQEVMRLNEGLEQRVQERTVQLRASNSELALAKEAAEKANEAKSLFLSSMSHELRTPLNAILGFGQLLESPDLPSTPVQKREFVEHIMKAGRHLLTLINEILDLAHIESGKVTLSLEPVSLAEVFADCRTMVEPVANQRSIRLVFPEDIDIHVMADRIRLKQVLLNLLSNAIKYNRASGTVAIDCACDADAVRVFVRDTGMGLRPDQLEALFEPFNRLGQQSGVEEGTGIGLVVTRKLVELMGGSVSVSSAVGIGSVFSVELKRAVSASSIADSAADRALVARTVTASGQASVVLYVEDNPANLRLIEEMIGFRKDLRLLTAPDARLGIELARAHRPNVILMDLNLPGGLSGSDARAIIHEDPRTRDIPVIAVSANAMPRDVAKGLAEGFFRYVTKPIDIGSLNEAIDSALANR